MAKGGFRRKLKSLKKLFKITFIEISLIQAIYARDVLSLKLHSKICITNLIFFIFGFTLHYQFFVVSQPPYIQKYFLFGYGQISRMTLKISKYSTGPELVHVCLNDL